MAVSRRLQWMGWRGEAADRTSQRCERLIASNDSVDTRTGIAWMERSSSMQCNDSTYPHVAHDVVTSNRAEVGLGIQMDQITLELRLVH